MVQLLRGRKVVTAEQLAERLEVSVRTVYRDIRDLESSGVPIIGEPGVGYQLQRGFELPPMTFNSDEIDALVLGARLVESHGDPTLTLAARSLLTKVEAVLPAALRGAIAGTPLFVPIRRADETAARFGVLRQAIAQRRCVRTRYTRGDGEASERRLYPVALFYWPRLNGWSVGAWCELRGAYRNFRLDRFDTLELDDERFDDATASADAFREHMIAQARADGWELPPGLAIG